ncbi:MAG: hypothetical protein PF439_06810 [Helicobacteraceae bacterium]|jgi:hypothetical protein|nr:hypothetical protein [Helicobacteraceae bacterium]
MRFTLVKDIKNDTLMRPLLGGLLLFILLFVSADILLKSDHIGLTESKLTQTLFGNEEEYIEAVNEHFLLELIHSDIFFMMMTLLTLSAVYARLCQNRSLRIININVTMIAALLTIILLPSAYYVSAHFVLPYIVVFYIWHIMAFMMTLASLFYLFIPQKSDLN